MSRAPFRFLPPAQLAHVSRWLEARLGRSEESLEIFARALTESPPDGTELAHGGPAYLAALASEARAWRDAVLDELLRTLERNRDTADLGGRLRRYLEIARTHEADAASTGTMESLTRLKEWTAERLPELARKHIESQYRPLRLWNERLVARLTIERRELVERPEKPRPADWRPIVRAVVAEEGGDPLTDAQADDIVATPHGRIRSPKAMALRMVDHLLAGRPQDLNPSDLKRELSRNFRPPVL